jgi:hypothetical protein
VDNSGEDDVVLSFTAFGTVLLPNFNLGAVSILDPIPAEVLELGDIDGNDEDNMVFSFTGFGTFVFKDMITLETLNPVGVATHLAIGNVDGN